MVVILPVSLMADDTGTAMLRSNPGVLLNKNPAPASAALFPDDLIETPKQAAARIEATGSTADINPETMVQFEGDELVLEHGSLSVNSNRGMRVRVGCLTVTPVNADWTHYEVSDVDGKVTVSAFKNDVTINERTFKPQQARQSAQSIQTLVREGEQRSREEKCGGAAPRQPPGHVDAVGAIMNSPWAKAAGLTGIGGLLCVAFCHDDDPVSPWKPGRKPGP